MRVVLWGTCDLSKPRVRILRDGLARNGVELVECHMQVWSDVRDKSQIGRAGWVRRIARILAAYPRLVWRYWRLPPHDWVLLGYPAVPDVFVIRLFAWLRRTPVAMDWFLSVYDTVVCDRRLVARLNPVAWLLWLVEWAAVRLADCAFMDTATHARRMERMFGLAPGRCGFVWVGVEDGMFPATTSATRAPEDHAPLRVLFYGQFIPLHGVPTIIEAARLLARERVDWQLVGTGQDASRVRNMLADTPLPRLEWVEWVDYVDLARLIERSDLCLGIFGTSAKAASVIPNKVFQAMAVGKPVLTRDSPAIRELIDRAPARRLLVPAGDPAALADAILHWREGAGPTTLARPELIRSRAIGRQLACLLADPGRAQPGSPAA